MLTRPMHDGFMIGARLGQDEPQPAATGPCRMRPARPGSRTARCPAIEREFVMDTYDLVVIGSGPAGQKAAIAASKLGYRAAVVDRGNMMGGVCINTGTIPSKTLREAVLYLTGLSQRELYGQAYRVKQDITIADVSARIAHVVNREIDVIRNQLTRNHVAMLAGTAPGSRTTTPSASSTTAAPAR